MFEIFFPVNLVSQNSDVPLHSDTHGTFRKPYIPKTFLILPPYLGLKGIQL